MATKATTWLKNKTGISSGELDLLVISTALKFLLFPAYRSTDFEVHRNWLAITRTLPLSKWYYDTTSEWTLDYPPFFAYFEFLLSLPARLVDPKIVDLNALEYGAWSVVAYQRTTVIVTELVLGAALLRLARPLLPQTAPLSPILAASIFLHPGLLVVDHIHFQYNGLLFGIMLWSIAMMREGRMVLGGMLFATLLNFKHIYMYIAPAYFIYLLRVHCTTPARFLSLAQTVIVTFAASLLPFAPHLLQLLSRLFPFKRGLCHAYWAPNVWALWAASDRVLLFLAKRHLIPSSFISIDAAGFASASRGLIGDTVFAILPNIKPIHTFIVTILCQSVFLLKLWLTPTYRSFVCAVTLCGWASYAFGWHVHEKAILLVLFPMSLVAAESHAMFRTFVIASAAGCVSLFPLLFTPAETPIKLLYTAIWTLLTFYPLQKRLYTFPTTPLAVLVDRLEVLYLLGLPAVQTAVMVLNGWSSMKSGPQITLTVVGTPGNTTTSVTEKDLEAQSNSGMEFLPLMLTSVYCAIGLGWAFARMGYLYVRS
ncbi:alpha-1,3-glucosyltransferase [Ceratobasidium sp. AG-Ba]|nr:alpha-1,3-glucosyltransferase [Ceratobasidium sp. AG-Ba]QRW01541.1 alpha-1,3-glucosyltransferase [Ceratobasidium sp. AG-Ba]